MHWRPGHGPWSRPCSCGVPSAHQSQPPSFPCRGDDGAAGECFHDDRTDVQKCPAQGREGTATPSAVLWRLRGRVLGHVTSRLKPGVTGAEPGWRRGARSALSPDPGLPSRLLKTLVFVLVPGRPGTNPSPLRLCAISKPWLPTVDKGGPCSGKQPVAI